MKFQLLVCMFYYNTETLYAYFIDGDIKENYNLLLR